MTPTISIAICTRNHPDELANCLRSLVFVRDKALEVIVVDNASDGDATRRVSEEFGAIYVREMLVGLEPARNRAIVTATGDIVAFIDDDCRVDAGWLDAITRAFSDPGVWAVTGQAIGADGDNWVQRQFNSFARGFCTPEPVEMTPEAVGDIYYRAVVGVGANMAYRRAILVALDGFPDVTRGVGDDDYMLYSVVRAGYKVRYTPASIVYQNHRSRLLSTIYRIFQYGAGGARVLWYLSAQDHSFPLFVKNFCWSLYWELRQLLRSVAHLRFWHLLFSLASFSGFCAGLFLPWGWRAHISGVLPAHGGLNRPERDYPKILPVLLYHRVGPDVPGAYPSLTVGPGRFREQMSWLKRKGYNTIGADDWLAYCLKGKALPERPVLLTFDDAYADLVEYAFPVLKENGFTGTVFVVTKEIGGRNSWDEREWKSIPCMSEEQIRHWSKMGISFGAHSRTHPDLTTLSEAELMEETAGSGRDLASILGTAPQSFAYPFGMYNDAVVSWAEGSFQLAFTCDEGLNGMGTRPCLLRRTMVQPDDSMLDFFFRVRLGWSPVEHLWEGIRKLFHPAARGAKTVLVMTCRNN